MGAVHSLGDANQPMTSTQRLLANLGTNENEAAGSGAPPTSSSPSLGGDKNTVTIRDKIKEMQFKDPTKHALYTLLQSGSSSGGWPSLIGQQKRDSPENSDSRDSLVMNSGNSSGDMKGANGSKLGGEGGMKRSAPSPSATRSSGESEPSSVYHHPKKKYLRYLNASTPDESTPKNSIVTSQTATSEMTSAVKQPSETASSDGKTAPTGGKSAERDAAVSEEQGTRSTQSGSSTERPVMNVSGYMLPPGETETVKAVMENIMERFWVNDEAKGGGGGLGSNRSAVESALRKDSKPAMTQKDLIDEKVKQFMHDDAVMVASTPSSAAAALGKSTSGLFVSGRFSPASTATLSHLLRTVPVLSQRPQTAAHTSLISGSPRFAVSTGRGSEASGESNGDKRGGGGVSASGEGEAEASGKSLSISQQLKRDIQAKLSEPEAERGMIPPSSNVNSVAGGSYQQGVRPPGFNLQETGQGQSSRPRLGTMENSGLPSGGLVQSASHGLTPNHRQPQPRIQTQDRSATNRTPSSDESVDRRRRHSIGPGSGQYERSSSRDPVAMDYAEQRHRASTVHLPTNTSNKPSPGHEGYPGLQPHSGQYPHHPHPHHPAFHNPPSLSPTPAQHQFHSGGSGSGVSAQMDQSAPSSRYGSHPGLSANQIASYIASHVSAGASVSSGAARGKEEAAPSGGSALKRSPDSRSGLAERLLRDSAGRPVIGGDKPTRSSQAVIFYPPAKPASYQSGSISAGLPRAPPGEQRDNYHMTSPQQSLQRDYERHSDHGARHPPPLIPRALHESRDGSYGGSLDISKSRSPHHVVTPPTNQRAEHWNRQEDSHGDAPLDLSAPSRGVSASPERSPSSQGRAHSGDRRTPGAASGDRRGVTTAVGGGGIKAPAAIHPLQLSASSAPAFRSSRSPLDADQGHEHDLKQTAGQPLPLGCPYPALSTSSHLLDDASKLSQAQQLALYQQQEWIKQFWPGYSIPPEVAFAQLAHLQNTVAAVVAAQAGVQGHPPLSLAGALLPSTQAGVAHPLAAALDPHTAALLDPRHLAALAAAGLDPRAISAAAVASLTGNNGGGEGAHDEQHSRVSPRPQDDREREYLRKLAPGVSSSHRLAPPHSVVGGASPSNQHSAHHRLASSPRAGHTSPPTGAAGGGPARPHGTLSPRSGDSSMTSARNTATSPAAHPALGGIQIPTPLYHSPHGRQSPTKSRDKDKLANRSAAPSLLGDFPSEDVLYLMCLLCRETYGNVHSFLKHFSRDHVSEGEPRRHHVHIESISRHRATQQDAAWEMGGVYDPRVSTGGVTSPGFQPHLRAHDAHTTTSASQRHLYDEHYYKEGDSCDTTLPSPLRRHLTHPTAPSSTPSSQPHHPSQPHHHPSSHQPHHSYQQHAPSSAELVCDECRVSFGDEIEWELHMSISHSNRTCVCRICNVGFGHIDAMYKHVHTAHNGLEAVEVEFNCMSCSKAFTNERSLIEHMKSKECGRDRGAIGSKISLAVRNRVRDQGVSMSPPIGGASGGASSQGSGGVGENGSAANTQHRMTPDTTCSEIPPNLSSSETVPITTTANSSSCTTPHRSSLTLGSNLKTLVDAMQNKMAGSRSGSMSSGNGSDKSTSGGAFTSVAGVGPHVGPGGQGEPVTVIDLIQQKVEQEHRRQSRDNLVRHFESSNDAASVFVRQPADGSRDTEGTEIPTGSLKRHLLGYDWTVPGPSNPKQAKLESSQHRSSHDIANNTGLKPKGPILPKANFISNMVDSTIMHNHNALYNRSIERIFQEELENEKREAAADLRARSRAADTTSAIPETASNPKLSPVAATTTATSVSASPTVVSESNKSARQVGAQQSSGESVEGAGSNPVSGAGNGTTAASVVDNKKADKNLGEIIESVMQTRVEKEVKLWLVREGGGGEKTGSKSGQGEDQGAKKEVKSEPGADDKGRSDSDKECEMSFKMENKLIKMEKIDAADRAKSLSPKMEIDSPKSAVKAENSPSNSKPVLTKRDCENSLGSHKSGSDNDQRNTSKEPQNKADTSAQSATNRVADNISARSRSFDRLDSEEGNLVICLEEEENSSKSNNSDK